MEQVQVDSRLQKRKVKEISSKRGEILQQKAELLKNRSALKNTNARLLEQGMMLTVFNAILHHERARLTHAVMDFNPMRTNAVLEEA